MMLICRLPIAPIYRGKVMVDQLLMGQKCHVKSSYGKLYYIETEYGYCGYIAKSALINKPQFCTLPQVLLTSPFTVILQKPLLRGPLLCSLPKGSVVAFIEVCSDNYVKIMLPSGTYGYCKASALKQLREPFAQKEKALRKAICDNALSYLGSDYLWGGKTHLGIDCSGLAFMAYYLEGITIYRDAVPKSDFAPKIIELASAKNGDLLYFKGHVAVYLGNNRFVHSTAFHGHEGVGIASLDPLHKQYRADLQESLYAVASVF